MDSDNENQAVERTDLEPARQLPDVNAQAVASAQPLPTPAAKRPTLPEVYDGYFNYVWTILRRLGVWDRDLEDATHDVFIVVHRRLQDYDANRPMRAWLAGIATRVASEFRRRAMHRKEVVSEDSHMEIASAQHNQGARDATDHIADREKRLLVARALTTLDDERRAVLVLHDIEGHAMPEIAAALDVNVNTLYARLRLARQQFGAAVTQLRSGGLATQEGV